MAYRMTAYRTDAGSEGWVSYSVPQPSDPVPLAGTYIRETIVEAPSGVFPLVTITNWADRFTLGAIPGQQGVYGPTGAVYTLKSLGSGVQEWLRGPAICDPILAGKITGDVLPDLETPTAWTLVGPVLPTIVGASVEFRGGQGENCSANIDLPVTMTEYWACGYIKALDLVPLTTSGQQVHSADGAIIVANDLLSACRLSFVGAKSSPGTATTPYEPLFFNEIHDQIGSAENVGLMDVERWVELYIQWSGGVVTNAYVYLDHRIMPNIIAIEGYLVSPGSDSLTSIGKMATLAGSAVQIRQFTCGSCG